MIKNAVWVQTMQKLHYKKWEHTSITAVSDPRLRAEMSLVGYVRQNTPPACVCPPFLSDVTAAVSGYPTSVCVPTISIGRYSSCLGTIRLGDGSHESSVLREHTPAAAVPYLGLGAEISLVG